MYIRKVITFRNAGTGCRYNIGTIFSFVLRTNSAGSTEETTQFHTTQPAGTGKAPLNYLSKRRHDARLHCVPTPRMPLRLIMHDEYSFRYIRSYNDDRQIAALRQRGHSGGIPVAGRGLYRRPHRPERSRVRHTMPAFGITTWSRRSWSRATASCSTRGLHRAPGTWRFARSAANGC